MSLVDRTNERIPLSLHRPQVLVEPTEGDAGVSFGPELYVDADGDSSLDPSEWVHIGWTDDDHDADRIKLTYEEAGLLADRLDLVLGRKGPEQHTYNDAQAQQ